jgi:hypothetical protein
MKNINKPVSLLSIDVLVALLAAVSSSQPQIRRRAYDSNYEARPGMVIISGFRSLISQPVPVPDSYCPYGMKVGGDCMDKLPECPEWPYGREANGTCVSAPSVYAYGVGANGNCVTTANNTNTCQFGMNANNIGCNESTPPTTCVYAANEGGTCQTKEECDSSKQPEQGNNNNNFSNDNDKEYEYITYGSSDDDNESNSYKGNNDYKGDDSYKYDNSYTVATAYWLYQIYNLKGYG